MAHLQTHLYYLELFLRRYQTMERWITCFLAITSSAGIGGWAIWQKYGFVWGLIIAASQVVNAVRLHLPYSMRRSLLRSVLPELNQLSLEMEADFYKVRSGSLTEEQIHELTIQYMGRRDAIVARLDESALPESPSYLAKAEADAESYFAGLYPTLETE
jgi:hypothetical protein